MSSQSSKTKSNKPTNTTSPDARVEPSKRRADQVSKPTKLTKHKHTKPGRGFDQPTKPTGATKPTKHTSATKPTGATKPAKPRQPTKPVKHKSGQVERPEKVDKNEKPEKPEKIEKNSSTLTKTFVVQSSKMVCADPASSNPQIVACLDGVWHASITTMAVGRLGQVIASLEVCHADYLDKPRKYAGIAATNQPDSGQYCFFDQPAYQQTVAHARKASQTLGWLGQCAYITQKAPYWSTLGTSGVVCASTGQTGHADQTDQTGLGFPILVDKRHKLAVALKVVFLQKPS